MLEQEADADAAAKQLTYAGEQFEGSVLDDAIIIEHGARPCRSFVAHAHCMALAQRYFYGDYPESRASIAPSSWARILLHLACLGLLPIVEVKHRRPMRREGYVADDDDTDDDDSDDEHHHLANDDEQMALAATSHVLLAPFFELKHLLNIPAVKFATHNVFAIAYTAFLAVGLCGMPWHGSAWMWRTGLQDPHVPEWEIVAWLWNLMRFVEEVQQLLSAKDKGEYFGNPYNQMDLMIYISLILAASTRWFVARQHRGDAYSATLLDEDDERFALVLAQVCF